MERPVRDLKRSQRMLRVLERGVQRARIRETGNGQTSREKGQEFLTRRGRVCFEKNGAKRTGGCGGGEKFGDRAGTGFTSIAEKKNRERRRK